MKASTRAWLIFAAALVLLGALGFAGVMTHLHWDFTALDAGDFRTETVEIRNEVRGVSILGNVEDITLLPSEDGTCRAEFFDRDTVTHTAAVDAEGTLCITRQEDESWLDHVGLITAKSPRITLYLPAGEYRALSIREETGEVSIPGDFRFGEIEIRVSTGDVICAASSAGELQIGTSTGDIRLQELSAGSMRLATSTGRVELRSIVCAGALELTVSTGEASLKDVGCGSFVSTGSTGDLRMEALLARELISVERSTGDVELDRCDAGALQIKTGTGDVRGTLLTGKRFQGKSDTGRVELPASTGGGSCEISTSTGDIRIELSK